MAGFFGIFDYTKPGKGVSKEDVDKKGINLYFDIIVRRFWKIITLNLIFLLFSIPAIIIGWFLSTYAVSWLAAIVGMATTTENVNGLTFISVFACILLLLVTGTGPASAGMNYVLRKYVNDTHSWVWSDFSDNAKANFKQSAAIYLINTAAVILCFVGFVFYSYAMSGMLAFFLKTVMIVIAALFFMMQMFTYQLAVSFELSIKDIYKNSFILLMVKLPSNIVAAAVTGFLVYLTFALTLSVPVAGIAIMLTLFYPIITFTQIFMTNNVVKKYILEPSLAAQEAQKKESADEDENIGG